MPDSAILILEARFVKLALPKTGSAGSFGNYLGPGHEITVIAGAKQIKLSDNLDGYYTGKSSIVAGELKSINKVTETNYILV